jgi:hypothetical protein
MNLHQVCWLELIQQIMKMSSAAQMEICHFIFCAISCFCVRKMSPSVVQIDICRLFRPSTDISHRKCCQQISFLWRGILSPSAQLIDPGQVTQSAHCSQSMVSSSFFITDIFFFSFGSCLLPVWSLTIHSHHQRRMTDLPTFGNSPLCSSWQVYLQPTRFHMMLFLSLLLVVSKLVLELCSITYMFT